MIGSSQTSYSIPFRSRKQPRLSLPLLLLPNSLCSHETRIRISCLKRSTSIMGILSGEELPPSFLPGLFYIRAIGGSKGLSNYSYWIAMGYFCPSNPPKSFGFLNRIKKLENIAIGVIRSMAGKRIVSNSYIDNILKLKAIA
jgi:hypothetical protein